MRFLRSEFRGQLPGRYREDLPLQQATSLNRPNEFNDMNLEEESRYVSRMQMNWSVVFCIVESSSQCEQGLSYFCDLKGDTTQKSL